MGLKSWVQILSHHFHLHSISGKAFQGSSVSLCVKGVMITIHLHLSLEKRNYIQESACYRQYTAHTDKYLLDGVN